MKRNARITGFMAVLVPVCCLTTCIDYYWLDALWQVALSAVVICGLTFLLYMRFWMQPSDTRELNRRQTTLFCLALTAVLGVYAVQVFNLHENLFLRSKPVTTTFINEGKVDDSLSSEIWLQVKEKGKLLSSEKLLDGAQYEGWFVKDGYLISCTEGEKLILEWDKPYDLEFVFQQHPYCGSVQVISEDNTLYLRLYSEEGKTCEIRPSWHTSDYYHPFLVISGIVLLAALVVCFVISIRQNADGRWQKLFYLCWILAVTLSYEVNMLTVDYAVIYLLSLVTVFFWKRINQAGQLERYCHGPVQIAIFVISVYLDIALTANRLFMLGSRMTFSINTVSYFLLMIALCYALVLLIVAGFQLLQAKVQRLMPEQDKGKTIRTRLICFTVVSLLGIFITSGFYPASMSPDSVTHWLEATGDWQLNDAHPPIFALFIRLLSNILPSPYAFVLFQVLFFAYLISDFAAFLYSKGVRLWVLISFSIIAILLPSNYMMLIYLSKNPLTMLLQLWVLLILTRMLDDMDRYFDSPWRIIKAAIAFSALYLVRRNHLTPYITVIAFMCFLSVYRKGRSRVDRLMPVFTVLCSFAMVWLVQGPLYNQFDIQHTPVSSASVNAPLAATLASAEYNEVELSDEVLDTMEEILPLGEWGKRYNRFNSDAFLYTEPNPSYNQATTGKLLRAWFWMLYHYPDIPIMSRLDGVESIWNIFASPAPGAYNSHYLIGITTAMPVEYLPLKTTEIKMYDAYSYISENKIEQLFLKIAMMTEKNEIIDSLLWRSGIYIVLMLILCMILCVQRKAPWIWVIAPAFSTLCTLLIVVGWQIFAYQCFYPISVRWFAIIALFAKPIGENRKRISEDAGTAMG